MKRCLLACFATGLVLSIISVAMPGENPGTGIQNTPHDFTRGGARVVAEDLNKICIYCHTPHQPSHPQEAAAAEIANYPICSQAVTTISAFRTYADVLDAFGQPGSVSLVCLSCHDGLIATNIYGFVSPDAMRYAFDGRGVVKASIFDLSRHHLIGFNYDAVEAKNFEIKPETSVLLGANRFDKTIKDLLRNGRIECPSCHDVHNTENEGLKFTWVNDSRSDFCFSCHQK